jgi:hypothetical protein
MPRLFPVAALAAALALPTFVLPAQIVTVGMNQGGDGLLACGTRCDGFVYQQAYAASAFGPNAVFIDALRLYGVPTQGGAMGGSIKFSIGTTTRAVNALSTSLASNVSSPLSLFAEMAVSGYYPFLTGVSATPFLYDPSEGNLLLQVESTGRQDQFFQADYSNSGQVGRAYGGTYPYADGYGFVTSFSVTATPEPASIILLGTGLVGLGFVVRKKDRVVSGSHPAT